jgi:hypothetical protein
MKRFLLSMIVVASAALSACSSDDGGSGPSGSGPATGCAADTRKDIYTAGIAKPAGDLSVKLLESKPGPPIKGTNTMTLEVLDAAGSAVDGATITVTPWMPDHAHGSAVAPIVTPMGSGKYAIDKVYLAMAGLWQIKVSVQPAGGGALQEATFQFCLDG